MDEKMNKILGGERVYVVVGVSRNKGKWGYRVFRRLLDTGHKTVAINPKVGEIDGEKCYPSLREWLSENRELLGQDTENIVVVTVVPGLVTEKVVQECGKLGLKKVWMQVGSESERAIELADEYEIEYVAGRCIVVDGLKIGWE